MRHRFAIVVVGFALFTCVVSGADKIWEGKPLNTWSDNELKSLLNESPWTGKAAVTHTKPGGNASPIDDTVFVMWSSALPIRQARVREQIGLNGPIGPEQTASLSQEVPAYVLTLKIEGASQGAARNAVAVAKQTFLMRDKKQPIPVGQAESRMLDKDGKPIEQPQSREGQPPGPPGGRGFGGGFGGFGGAQGGSALLIMAFPKTDPIVLDDKEVELVTRIGQYNVKKKFKLKDMVVKGVLAL